MRSGLQWHHCKCQSVVMIVKGAFKRENKTKNQTKKRLRVQVSLTPFTQWLPTGVTINNLYYIVYINKQYFIIFIKHIAWNLLKDKPNYLLGEIHIKCLSSLDFATEFLFWKQRLIFEIALSHIHHTNQKFP